MDKKSHKTDMAKTSKNGCFSLEILSSVAKVILCDINHSPPTAKNHSVSYSSAEVRSKSSPSSITGLLLDAAVAKKIALSREFSFYVFKCLSTTIIDSAESSHSGFVTFHAFRGRSLEVEASVKLIQ